MSSTYEPWRPEAGVTDHGGQPLDPAREFFASPPPEVGLVTSASTTLFAGDLVWPKWLRLALYAMATALVGAVAIRLTDPLLDTTDPDIWLPHGMIWALAVMGGLTAQWLVKWPRTVHECCFVGRDGVAVFTLRSGAKVAVKVLMPFASADGLYRSDAHYSAGGVFRLYAGTHSFYTWCDAAGRVLINWFCGHTEKGRPPRRHSPHERAAAAERAWTEHRVRRAASEVTTHGFTTFRVRHQRIAIRVGFGFLELTKGDAVVRLTPDQVRSFTAEDGRLSIRTHDAKFFGQAGKFDFATADVADVDILTTVAGSIFLGGASTPGWAGSRAA